MALSTTSSNNLGSQAQTQSPQNLAASGAGSPAAAPAGDVQPGTATSLLSTDQGGIALGGGSLSTVQLGGAAGEGQTSAEVEQAAKPAHHVSPAFVSISVGLFVVAVAVFWFINRSAKNTTE